ncbi:hypothetical protein BDZ97DRAFT_1846469 [Flammula alnicola]|nr:hypothetical protein BDZ97DRAFT_1846469 [Flammula alnicola]
MVRLAFNKVLSATVLALASLGGVAADGLQVTSPSSSIWWVAKSQNLIAWSCHNTSIVDFTVLVTNQSPAIAVAPLAIIAIQQNFDCSIIITQDQANQPTGTGWEILLANPLNNTDVYATSEPFEIKPLGSLYPSQQSAGASVISGSATGSSTAPAATQSTKSGAGKLAVGGAGVVAGFVAMAMGVWA